MSEEKEEKGSSSVPFLLIGLGAALGVLAGMLLAPDKGSETRRRVGGWIKDRVGKD